MRLWSLHPQYLDRQGLLALWREGLLAQKVLAGGTKGYRQHPRLIRFREASDPLNAIGCFLAGVSEVAARRGYKFDTSKIMNGKRVANLIFVTRGQIDYERKHLLGKLKIRNKILFHELLSDKRELLVNPIFCVTEGAIHSWEKLSSA